MTTVRIATGVRPSMLHAAMMAGRRFSSASAGAVFLAAGVALAVLPVWLLSLLPGFLAVFAVPVSLMCCFLAVFVILGAAFGLPLMLSALMSENSDCFDALSRAYAYALQRPLRYAFYLFIGAFFGLLGKLMMSALVWLAAALFFAVSGKDPADVQCALTWYFIYTAGLLPVSFTIIYVTSLFSGIYMLLRRDVDAVELDEVWLPKSLGVPLPELPKLR